MNVAFDCERMKYPYTGLYEYCHLLGQALWDVRNIEDDVYYYARKRDKNLFNKDAKHLNKNYIHKLIFPKYEDIDVWHTTYQASSYMPDDKKLKKVITIHDLNFLYEKDLGPKRASYLKKHQLNIDNADHIIVISEFTKNDVIKNLNIRDKPLSVIYNGCDVEIFPNYINTNYTQKPPFLFAIGTVNAKKNFHVLPALLKGNNFNLIIAGKEDPNYVTQIIEEARKHNVEERVKIIGTISNEEKYFYLKNCEAFLFPSIAEGFGIPVIEAMTFGKPVFLSKATSLPEIGGEFAYYFNYFDADYMQETFAKGLNHYNLNTPEMAIINHAKKFDWKVSAKAYWDIYQSLK